MRVLFKLLLFFCSLPFISIGQSALELHTGYNFQYNTTSVGYHKFEISKNKKSSVYADIAFSFSKNEFLKQKIGFSYKQSDFDVHFLNRPLSDMDYFYLEEKERLQELQFFYLEKLNVFKKLALKPEFGMGSTFYLFKTNHYHSVWGYSGTTESSIQSSTNKYKKWIIEPYLIVGFQYEKQLSLRRYLLFEFQYTKYLSAFNRKQAPNYFYEGLNNFHFNIGFKYDISKQTKNTKLQIHNALKHSDSTQQKNWFFELGSYYFKNNYFFGSNQRSLFRIYKTGNEKNFIRSNGFGFQLLLKRKRLVLIQQLAFESILLDYFGYADYPNFMNTNHSAYINQHGNISYEYKSKRSSNNYTIGIGRAIFNQKSRINIIPMLQLQFSNMHTQKVLFDQSKTHYYYHAFVPTYQEIIIDTTYFGNAHKYIEDRNINSLTPIISIFSELRLFKQLKLTAYVSRLFFAKPFFRQNDVIDYHHYQFGIGLVYSMSKRNKS